MKRKIIVIGSGLAGTLICNQLAKAHDVILLEKGSEKHISLPKIKFVNKPLAQVPTFCYGAGGTTNLWHNGLIPIHTEDVCSATFRKVLDEARPYMDQAASALFFENRSFSGEHARLVADIKSLTESCGAFHNGVDCLVYPKYYKRLTLDGKVVPCYNVTDLDFRVDAGKVTHVRCRFGKRVHELEADTVIVSAGAMGTPLVLHRIMEVLGSEPSRAGVGFIDHPMGFVGKVKFQKNYSRLAKRLSLSDHGDYVSRSAIRLKSPCGTYTGCAFLRPALTMDNSLSIYKYKSSLGASHGLSRVKNAFSAKLFHPDIVAEIISHLCGISIPGRIYNILFIGEQKRCNNRVFHEDGTLRVDWTVNPEEIDIYRGMLLQLEEMLGDLAEEVRLVTDVSEDWLWSAAHHSCTTSLGEAGEAVVDANLKLKCCDNVYVCDGSVIQEHSYANTGLTIGQLALRLAERVRHGTA